MGRYYDLFKHPDSDDTAESVRAALAELTPLASASKLIIDDFMGEPGPPRHIRMSDIRPFSAKFSRCDKRVALAVGIYCAMREDYFTKFRAMSVQQQSKAAEQDRTDVAQAALWITWCRDTDTSEESTPPDEFYRFLFSYKDAVVFLGDQIDGYVLWLNLTSNGDKTWWGGVKKEYKDAAALLHSALELATADYVFK